LAARHGLAAVPFHLKIFAAYRNSVFFFFFFKTRLQPALKSTGLASRDSSVLDVE